MVERPRQLEITAVLQSRPSSELVLDATLAQPEPGSAFDRTTFEVSGWVVGRNSQPRVVEVVAGADTLRTIPVDVPRPDVAAYLSGAPEKSGFWALTGAMVLDPTFSLDVQAVFDDGAVAPLGVIVGKLRPLATSYEPRLRPLLLTSLGRTGTTLAMNLLSAHPNVVTHREYPFEMFPGRYWLHMLRVLSEPANHAESSHPETFAGDASHVGHNPFHTAPLTTDPALLHLLGQTYVERLARVCQTTMDDLYTRVAASQGQSDVEFFVEKFQPGPLPRVARLLYPGAREIFLVRDFRDVICSVFAFNEKRGGAGFGRDQVETDEDYVAYIERSATRLLDDWKSRSADSLLIRYEDLATRPEETLEPVFDYLGLPRGPELMEELMRTANGPALGEHRTTGSVEDSIGRWRRELSPELRAACRSSLDPVLEEFGYEPTDGGGTAPVRRGAAKEFEPDSDDVTPEAGPRRSQLDNLREQRAALERALVEAEADRVELAEVIRSMQATRAWRFGTAYWNFRDRLLRRRSG